ncbi:class I SAM-dependent RNA methyltransferase [Emcibacter sp. SYSU 3D8]|uniref:class I SAM-dependent RNA methyltransferase n=1 Tax=Emcibacter sp. SYSU 3D8 TaxID=3133969 RepID=UPI0031FE4401
MTDPIDVHITALGAQGDGVAEVNGERVYVPFTVPGDLARILAGEKRGDGRSAELLEIIEAGPGRVTPACVHFGICGGCALQHLDDAPYAAFKRDQVVRALAHQGFRDVEVAAPLIVPPRTRRRTRLTARRSGDRVLLGYLERGSHRMVGVTECPVILPRLEALMRPLRGLLASVLGAKDTLHLTLTATDTGVDLLIAGERRPNMRALQSLAAFAEAQDLARISWESKEGVESIAVRRPPTVLLGKAGMPVPPGAFLQATKDSEDWMIDRARGAVAGAKHVADLFAGCGTFTAAIAEKSAVSAFESSAEMVDACRRGLNHAHGLHPVTLSRRDLFREPLTAKELSRFDAVVIDPPRAGAKAQTEMLAISKVPVVAAFSCNPSTFARDARAMADGGYTLEAVTPIDQFRWSAHVELAALFRKS